MTAGAGLAFSTCDDGDFAVDADPAALAVRREAFAPGVWTWLRQVHGPRVVTVHEPGEHAGAEADAAVTAVEGAVLAVHTADCVPVLFADRAAGVVGVCHVGWRGLVAGVLEATVAAMADLGATAPIGHVGPHIRARCYEFGADDLDRVALASGPGVRGTTAWGTPALDLVAGVRAALDGRATVIDHGGCTACEPGRYYSHRARGDAARLASVATLVPGTR